jgi:hypothetical protein
MTVQGKIIMTGKPKEIYEEGSSVPCCNSCYIVGLVLSRECS